jgi:hypothetical protein
MLPDLANTGFNDRAQSLRVERGYWIFCSDAGFQGTCRTFGPGSYPNLGWGLDNKVSSGRRISNDYPYNGPPKFGAATIPGAVPAGSMAAPNQPFGGPSSFGGGMQPSPQPTPKPPR